MTDPRRAVVLVSGGLDSAVTLAVARAEGFEAYALSFAYGQRHAAEVDAARRVVRHLGAASHVVSTIDLRTFGGSALTAELEVPKDRPASEIAHGIPVTYVPARNTIFLAFALAWAEVLGTGDLFLGVNALDYSGYPDCRPEYLDAFERMANLATRGGVEGTLPVKVHAPLLRLTKALIVRRGVELGVDLSLTVSCYEADDEGRACGRCDSCALRRRGFLEAGLPDSTRYVR